MRSCSPLLRRSNQSRCCNKKGQTTDAAGHYYPRTNCPKPTSPRLNTGLVELRCMPGTNSCMRSTSSCSSLLQLVTSQHCLPAISLTPPFATAPAWSHKHTQTHTNLSINRPVSRSTNHSINQAENRSSKPVSDRDSVQIPRCATEPSEASPLPLSSASLPTEINRFAVQMREATPSGPDETLETDEPLARTTRQAAVMKRTQQMEKIAFAPRHSLAVVATAMELQMSGGRHKHTTELWKTNDKSHTRRSRL